MSVFVLKSEIIFAVKRLNIIFVIAILFLYGANILHRNDVVQAMETRASTKSVESLIDQFDAWIFERGKHDKPTVFLANNYSSVVIVPNKDDFVRLKHLKKPIFSLVQPLTAFEKQIFDNEFFDRSIRERYFRFNNFLTGSLHNPDLIVFISGSSIKTKLFEEIMGQIDRQGVVKNVSNLGLCNLTRFVYSNIVLKTIALVDLHSENKSAYMSAYFCYIAAHMYHLGVSGILSAAGVGPDHFFSETGRLRSLRFAEYGLFLKYREFFPFWALYQADIHPGVARTDALNRARKLAKRWVENVGFAP